MTTTTTTMSERPAFVEELRGRLDLIDRLIANPQTSDRARAGLTQSRGDVLELLAQTRA